MTPETKAKWTEVFGFKELTNDQRAALVEVYQLHDKASEDQDFWETKYNALKTIYQKSLVKVDTLPILQQIEHAVAHLRDLRQKL